MSDPLPIGAVMKDPGGDHWRVDAVMRSGGERYYMMSLTPDDISMMPAFVVEQWERVSEPAQVVGNPEAAPNCDARLKGDMIYADESGDWI